MLSCHFDCWQKDGWPLSPIRSECQESLHGSCARVIVHGTAASASNQDRLLQFSKTGSRTYFVLPDSNHPPTRTSQQSVLETVPLSVGLNLGQPPIPAGLWNTAFRWMPVPKLPVHKDGCALCPEKEVGADTMYFPIALNFDLLPPPPTGDSGFMENTNHRKFCGFVPAGSDARHAPAALLRRQNVSHVSVLRDE